MSNEKFDKQSFTFEIQKAKYSVIILRYVVLFLSYLSFLTILEVITMEEAHSFKLRASDLQEMTGVNQAKINRYRSKRIIPQEYVSQNQSGGRWIYRPEAAEWIQFANRIMMTWHPTEDQVADVFMEIIRYREVETDKALKTLQQAYENARTFDDFRSKINY
jgi:hypothetical protein